MQLYGLSTTDALIKTAIELAVEDLIKNPWVIEHMYSSFIENPILNKKYGYKEIARAKEFLLNNKIHFYQKHRKDKMEFPCVTISLSQTSEDAQLATLADQSHIVHEYSPEQINKPISYIIKPTQILSYDPLTGIMEIPENESYKYISAGMSAINPDTGEGYVIEGKAGEQGFLIPKNLEINFERIAVIPQYLTYRARMERIVTKETYSIGCHAHGDPSLTLFLYNLVKYALLRYRESLFEQFNFQLGTITASDTIENDAFGADDVYSRFITLSGQVEEYWVKTPFRKWEAIDFIDRQNDLVVSGIKILSNKTDGEEEDVWTTVQDNEEE